jgi:hypothetical protein
MVASSRARRYRDWPVFRQLRDQEGFGAIYKEIFGSDFAADLAVTKTAAPDSGKVAAQPDAPDIVLKPAALIEPGNAATQKPTEAEEAPKAGDGTCTEVRGAGLNVTKTCRLGELWHVLASEGGLKTNS